MELLISNIVTIFAGFFSNVIFRNWEERRHINKSKITGTWTATLHKEYPDAETKDIVMCKHNEKTEQVSGEIHRSEPIEENEKKWKFSGKFIDGVIYITFWSITDRTSDGTIIMNFHKEKKAFSGQYMKYRDTSTDSHSLTKKLVATDIDWKFERKTLDFKNI